METYVALGGLMLLLGVLFYLVWRFGKSAGASAQEATSSGAGLKVEQKMAQAGADAPSDLRAVEDRARRGEF
ncbi:hypothetical protein [Hypericibacter sp.]|uniref:hypothetical protein n=1 Tax=Hypericibacter sp. TaxID=2705401 RepID=UPI003D6CB2AC